MDISTLNWRYFYSFPFRSLSVYWRERNLTFYRFQKKSNKKGVIVFGDIFLLRSRKTDAILLLWGWYNNKELQKVKTFLILRNIVQHIGWKSPFDVRRGQMSNYTNTRKRFLMGFSTFAVSFHRRFWWVWGALKWETNRVSRSQSPPLLFLSFDTWQQFKESKVDLKTEHIQDQSCFYILK